MAVMKLVTVILFLGINAVINAAPMVCGNTHRIRSGRPGCPGNSPPSRPRTRQRHTDHQTPLCVSIAIPGSPYRGQNGKSRKMTFSGSKNAFLGVPLGTI